MSYNYGYAGHVQRTREMHNGYTNHETWSVADQIGSSEYWQERTRYHIKEAKTHKGDRCGQATEYTSTCWAIAKELEKSIRYARPWPRKDSLYSGLLGIALDKVNWSEIAEHWIEDERL